MSAKANVDKVWFQSRMKERGLTMRGVARRMNIHFTALSRTLSGERRMQIDEVRKIATILGASEGEVLARADAPIELGDNDAVLANRHETGGTGSGGMRTGRRHPLFGCLKGMLTPVGEVDPTEPPDPEWGRLYE